MEPTSVTQRSLEFAAPVSPWWLLLLIPCIVVGAWWLYRGQWKDLSKGQGPALLALRAVILCLLALLLFRPSLVSREVRTFPGVVTVLVDSSGSMAASDSYTDTQALWLARQLGRIDGSAHALATRIMQMRNTLRTFESFAKETTRDDDAFWVRADAVQTELLAELAEVGQQLPALRASIENTPDLDADLKALTDGLAPFFMGDRAPSSQAYRDYDAQLVAFAGRLYDLQARRDTIDLRENDTLTATATSIRSMPRHELIAAILARQNADMQTAARDMYVQLLDLQGAEIPAGSTLAAEGPTPLYERLDIIAESPSDFPLAGIVVMSDGRASSGESTAATAKLARNQTPVMAAAIGTTEEPQDLAILAVRAAPFAVKGRPFAVTVQIKTAVPAGTAGTLQLMSGATVVAQQELEMGAAPSMRVRMQVTPSDTGLVRYTARLSSVDGEVFPALNNRQDIAVTVRDDRVRVLLLDQSPRWETRFAMNILQRLDYVDTNAIITVVQPNGELRRGVERGAWPEDLASLEIYDLVIIGDLPADTLSEAEWNDLRTFVLDKGRTLCILGNGRDDGLPAALQDELLPTRARTSAATDALSLSELCLTPAGASHPLTRAMLGLGGVHPTGPDTPGMRPETVPLLLASPGGRPIVSARWCGSGQTIYVDHDALWKRLNPTMLHAHSALWMALVNLAARRPPADEDGVMSRQPSRLITPIVTADREVTLWLPDATAGSYEALVGDEVVATATANPVATDATSGYATFDAIPAGDFVIRAMGSDDAAATGVAIADNREYGLLSQDEAALRALARDTAGVYGHATDLAQFIAQIPAKQRVEKRETNWRLWDSGWLLAAILVLLSIEWIWRKLVGLV